MSSGDILGVTWLQRYENTRDPCWRQSHRRNRLRCGLGPAFLTGGNTASQSKLVEIEMGLFFQSEFINL